MTDRAQQIAIAEAFGWEHDEVCDVWRLGEEVAFMNGGIHHRQLPDYVNDLNAMHEAEKVLTDKQWDTYTANLNSMLWSYGMNYNKCIVHATADERAEAFLRTIGKWEETA